MEALLPVLTSARVTVRLATACYLTIDTGPIVNKQGELVAVIETSHDVIGYKKTTMCRQLKALRGPFDVQMGQRYAHLTAKHLAPYADRLCALRQGDEVSAGAYGTFTAQRSKEKGPAASQTLDYVARPAGFEPTTPWFVDKGPIAGKRYRNK